MSIEVPLDSAKRTAGDGYYLDRSRAVGKALREQTAYEDISDTHSWGLGPFLCEKAAGLRENNCITPRQLCLY
jgi:hypothetical protein